MRRVKIFWKVGRTTPNGHWLCRRHLPVRQTLVWVGPVFILIQPKGA